MLNRGKDFISTKQLGLFAFIAVGLGLFISTAINEVVSIYRLENLIILGIFYTVSLYDYYKSTRHTPVEFVLDKELLKVLLATTLGAGISWYANHVMGHGSVIGSSIVGIVAAAILSADLAGKAYMASFLGMSSLQVIPNLGFAILGGFIVGIISIITADIYNGFGGKAGTTACVSTFITRAIVSIFG